MKIFTAVASALFCYRRSTWKVSLPIATLSFDYTYEFTDQERILQRVYRVTLKDNSTLATPLCLYNFSTGHAWDYWVVYDLAYLLKGLEKDDPSTEALRFLYNWITYRDYLVFDLKIEDDIKIRLLKAIYVHGYMPEPSKTTRSTKDHLRGATEAK